MRLILLLRALYWEVRMFNLLMVYRLAVPTDEESPSQFARRSKALFDSYTTAVEHAHAAFEDLWHGTALYPYNSSDARIERRRGKT